MVTAERLLRHSDTNFTTTSFTNVQVVSWEEGEIRVTFGCGLELVLKKTPKEGTLSLKRKTE